MHILICGGNEKHTLFFKHKQNVPLNKVTFRKRSLSFKQQQFKVEKTKWRY